MASKANAPYCLIENDVKVMEIVLEILKALVYWRLVLSVGVSALVAFWLSWMFPSFTSGYCIALVSLGTGLGIMWQTRPKGGAGLPAPVPPAPMSKPVAFLGFMFIGNDLVFAGAALLSGYGILFLLSLSKAL